MVLHLAEKLPDTLFGEVLAGELPLTPGHARRGTLPVGGVDDRYCRFRVEAGVREVRPGVGPGFKSLSALITKGARMSSA